MAPAARLAAEAASGGRPEAFAERINKFRSNFEENDGRRRCPPRSHKKFARPPWITPGLVLTTSAFTNHEASAYAEK
jgi:hypothetical protein